MTPSIILQLHAGVYSARTRAVGIFLYKNFLDKKRREEDEALNLTHLLKGKAKKNSARLFYEILVLKTGDCINVRQDKAYDDIMLQEVPKLKQISETNVAEHYMAKRVILSHISNVGYVIQPDAAPQLDLGIESFLTVVCTNCHVTLGWTQGSQTDGISGCLNLDLTKLWLRFCNQLVSAELQMAPY